LERRNVVFTGRETKEYNDKSSWAARVSRVISLYLAVGQTRKKGRRKQNKFREIAKMLLFVIIIFLKNIWVFIIFQKKKFTIFLQKEQYEFSFVFSGGGGISQKIIFFPSLHWSPPAPWGISSRDGPLPSPLPQEIVGLPQNHSNLF
jgi:hypothetical protein